MAARRSNLSIEVTGELLHLGFLSGFAYQIGEQMNTDFLAEQMLKYLREYKPRRTDDVADEVITILEKRDKLIQWNMENKKKATHANDLFLKGFEINWDYEDLEKSYISKIEAIKGLSELKLSKNITFLVGENGSGKSTLLEGLAVALGLNPEGGTVNYMFSTYDDYSPLSKGVRLKKGYSKPTFSYFLRAESFYNVATAANVQYGSREDYHAQSHGESFLSFIQKANSRGLYLMDEPEAALSPQRQLTLLRFLIQMAEKGSQFIIVTHSPILLGAPDAEIFSFDGGEVHEVEYEETESVQIMRLFLDNRDYMIRALMKEYE